MVKIIYFLFCFLVCNACISQITMSAYKLDVGHLVNNEWVFDGEKKVNYTVKIYKETASVNDSLETRLLLTNKRYDKILGEQISHHWVSPDKENSLVLTEHKNSELLTLAFVYKDRCMVYYVKNIKVSK